MFEIKYSGDGQTKKFVFSFPFFTPSDVFVMLNGDVIHSGYQLSTVSNQESSDIPYSGGTVTFDVAPKLGDNIKIFRRIGVSRVVDYQPTKPIDPQALNQDFSFMLEKLKDFDGMLTDFYDKYSDIINSDSYNVFTQKLDDINNKLNALGGIDNIGKKSDITALQNATSFTASGKESVVSWLQINGKFINANFLGTEAGGYLYTPEAHGILSVVFTANVSGDAAVEAPDAKTIYHKSITVNARETILLPVHKGLQIKFTVPALKEVNYQRLFLFKGEQ